jgi:hypothetical protein
VLYAIVALVAGVVGVVVGFLAGRATMVAAGPAGLPGGAGGTKGLPMRHEDVIRANPKDLRKGGLVTAKNFGDDFEDADLEFDAYTKYTRDREEWHELRADYRNRHVGLGWTPDGELYALKHLKTKRVGDVGLSVEQVVSLTKGAQVEAAGATYQVLGAGKCLSHDNGTGFGKELEAWDLVTADRKQLLRVERRGDDEPVVTEGEKVDPSDIEIFRVKS